MIIDTHCHLDFPEFDHDRAVMIARARENGVDGFILIGINPKSWTSTQSIAQADQRIWRTTGIHPNSAAELWSDTMLSRLRAGSSSGDVVAIGETGIDLFRSRESLEIQTEAFRDHLRLAQELELPVVIHQRDAEREVLNVLREAGGIRGVLHCFGGDWAFASECLELGLFLGIGGVATYKRSDETRDAIAKAPGDRLLLETDAPFLPPQSRRGKRNEPAFLSEVVHVVATCRSTSGEAVERLTTENAHSLFGLSPSAVETTE